MTLEFLGLNPDASYSETKLENAIIDKMQHFLLELGKGFLFEARQKRFTFDEENFYVDLVFYNRLLQCYVLIDLKVGKLTHQDLGQMQMYVNYYDRYVKQDFEKADSRHSAMQREERRVGRIDTAKGFQYLRPAICPLFAG